MCEAECAICLSCEDDGWHTLECQHRFHTRCIVDWFRRDNAVCPICRSQPEREESSGVAEIIQEHMNFSRDHRNYINRRNRLARSNAQIGGLRSRLQQSRNALKSSERELENVIKEVERKLLQDETFVQARREYATARNKFNRLMRRYVLITESILGPEPQSHTMLRISVT